MEKWRHTSARDGRSTLGGGAYYPGSLLLPCWVEMWLELVKYMGVLSLQHSTKGRIEGEGVRFKNDYPGDIKASNRSVLSEGEETQGQ